MDSIVENLMTQLTSVNALSLIGQKAGADSTTTKSTLETALPLLLGVMSKNASKPEGLSTIMNSLSQVSSNNPVDNISNHLSASDHSAGSDMLSSLLGGNAQSILQSVSKSTGSSTSTVSQILAMATPLLMGSLSKNLTKSTTQSTTQDTTQDTAQNITQSTTQNMGAQDLTKLLGEQSQTALSSSPNATGILQELLTSEESSGGLMAKAKKLLGS